MLEQGRARAMRAPQLGICDWFPPGDRGRVERALGDMVELGIAHLRTEIAWPDAAGRAAEEWRDWLVPRLAREAALLPAFEAPPGLEPASFAELVDRTVARLGACF